MFSGTGADVPANWSLCDGSNGTPDLRNRFVIAANEFNDQGSPAPNRWETNVEGGAGRQSGGSKDSTLTEHNHTLQGGNASGNFLTSASLSYNNAGPFQYGGDATAVSGITFNTQSGSVNYNQPTADNEGSGDGTNANLPPYFAVAFIMRVT